MAELPVLRNDSTANDDWIRSFPGSRSDRLVLSILGWKRKRFTQTTKHMMGRHAQKRHGWRFGPNAKAPSEDAEEWSKRAARRGVSPPVPKKKTAAEKGLTVIKTGPGTGVEADEAVSARIDLILKTMKMRGYSDSEVAAIRSVIEGYQVHDKKTGMDCFIRDVVLDGHDKSFDIIVSGRLYDKDGNSAGWWERRVKVSDGAFVIENALLSIYEKHQGSGFAQRFYQHCEEVAMKNGIHAIELHANLDVGGYAWAKMGFNFRDKHQRGILARHITREWVDRYGKDLPDYMDKLIVLGELQPFHIAALVGPDGFKIGKEALLGSDWFGVKYLNSDDIGYQVGEAYYATKE